MLRRSLTADRRPFEWPFGVIPETDISRVANLYNSADRFMGSAGRIRSGASPPTKR
jgi:hypothetical protein